MYFSSQTLAVATAFIAAPIYTSAQKVADAAFHIGANPPQDNHRELQIPSGANCWEQCPFEYYEQFIGDDFSTTVSDNAGGTYDFDIVNFAQTGGTISISGGEQTHEFASVDTSGDRSLHAITYNAVDSSTPNCDPSTIFHKFRFNVYGTTDASLEGTFSGGDGNFDGCGTTQYLWCLCQDSDAPTDSRAPTTIPTQNPTSMPTASQMPTETGGGSGGDDTDGDDACCCDEKEEAVRSLRSTILSVFQLV